MANVFVSYNRQSKAIARTLTDDIKALGHTVWFDQELSGGQTWWNQILARIRESDVFVFILNPEALESTACKREYGYAADLGKAILPVLVAEGVPVNLLPPALSQIQFVDYRKQDRDAAFHLARALDSIPRPPSLPDPLPVPPEAPISYLGNLSDQIETTSTLSYEEQSALLIDLKRSLRDPEAAHDARTLLDRLRKRRDLLACIAEEIDELLPGMRKVVSAEPEINEDHKEAPARIPAEARRESRRAQTHQPSTRERLICSLVGAISGSAVGMAAMATVRGSQATPVIVWGLFMGVAGAISGAITGKNRRLIVAVLLGAALGWFTVASLITAEGGQEPIAGGTFAGALPGAILGAICGVIIRKVKKWP